MYTTLPKENPDWPTPAFRLVDGPLEFLRCVLDNHICVDIITRELNEEYKEGERIKFMSWTCLHHYLLIRGAGDIKQHTSFCGLFVRDIVASTQPSQYQQVCEAMQAFMTRVVSGIVSPIMQAKFTARWCYAYYKTLDEHVKVRDSAHKQTKKQLQTTFHASASVVAHNRQTNDDRRRAGLTQPLVVPYEDIYIVARSLWKTLTDNGTDLNWINKGRINTPEQVTAGLCLIQLCSGSRSAGVIAINTFDRGEYNNIVVANITKQPSDVNDLRITKPLIYDFFNPFVMIGGGLTRIRADALLSLLPAWMINEESLPIDGFQTSLFLLLVRACRQETLDPALFHKIDTFKCTLAPSVTTTHLHVNYAFYSNNRHLTRTAINVWGRAMGELLLKISITNNLTLFTAARKRTHQLRKLYVVLSYEVYTHKTMKEVAYCERVLGHKALSTSLFYTSMRLTFNNPTPLPTTPTSVLIPLDTIAGGVTYLPKLARLKRGTSKTDAHMRHQAVLALFTVHAVKPTTKNIRAIGLQSTRYH